MSSWFQTTDNVKHVTSLPADISRERAIRFLHNHVGYLKCNPHMVEYRPKTPSDGSVVLPEQCRDGARGEPKYFSVTDRVHKLPAGLWDSDVVSTYEFVNLETGLFVRLRSQMGVVMETIWEIKEAEGGKGYVMVEAVLIMASRLLIGIVRGMCDSGWQSIHEKMLSMM